MPLFEMFANQNVVCKLRQPATLAFLAKEFGEGHDTSKPRAEAGP